MLSAGRKEQIYCRGYQAGDLFCLVPGWRRGAEFDDLYAAAKDGLPGWTVTKGDAVVACAFVQMVAKDHANVAAMVDDKLKARDWALITRFVRAKFRHLTAAGVVRITATVRADVPQARAYLERFGFTDDDSFNDNPPGYMALTRSTA